MINIDVLVAYREGYIDAMCDFRSKMGHWIFIDEAHEHARCSKCGYGEVDLFDGKPHNYCQNCGIKIKEDKE